MPAPEAFQQTHPHIRSEEMRRRARQRAAADPRAFAYTIPDAQSMGAPGRTKIYELAKDGKLKLLRVAGRTLVDGASLRALLGVAA
jgi:hypothetical protein